MADRDQVADRVFDHEYDGIQEYDNPMPRWWVYLFLASILLAFPYVTYYHFGQGQTILEQLDAEIAAYSEQLLATYGELKPNAATISAYMEDDVAMTGMGALFKGKCAQCHQADGSGNVGPNLTDQRWINIKRLEDIPDLLVEGRVTKGMPAWGDRLSSTEIVLLSSYVARMRENPLPGKAPEGEELPPWSAIPPADEADATH